MNFVTYGPFEIPRLQSRLIVRKGAQRDAFWKEIDGTREGLSHGCGCYVFAVRNKSITPWYVGKAERQSFSKEAFQAQKLNYYNEVVTENRGTPVIFLLAKTTPKGKLSVPTRREYPSVTFLENALIAMALGRNPDLCNVSGTRILRGLSVPGILTPTRGRKGPAVCRLRETLGISGPHGS